MQAGIELLLRQVRLQDLDSVVANDQTSSAIRSNSEARVALSVDPDLTLDVDLRA